MNLSQSLNDVILFLTVLGNENSSRFSVSGKVGMFVLHSVLPVFTNNQNETHRHVSMASPFNLMKWRDQLWSRELNCKSVMWRWTHSQSHLYTLQQYCFRAVPFPKIDLGNAGELRYVYTYSHLRWYDGALWDSACPSRIDLGSTLFDVWRRASRNGNRSLD